MRVKAEEKGLQLNFKIQPHVQSRFISDPLRIRQILSNLVGNSIKFTDSGTVDLLVDQDEDHLLF